MVSVLHSVAFALAAVGASAAPSEVELITSKTPWRAFLVHGPNLQRDKGVLKLAQRHGAGAFDPAEAEPEKLGFTPLPAPDWAAADFDDSSWARYLGDDLLDFLGDYGIPVRGRTWPTLLYLRTRFGIADPAKAAGLKLTVACLGGAIVHLNGRQVARAHMPAGICSPLTPADNYPLEAYVTEDGATGLPVLTSFAEPEQKWLDRFRKRIRTFTVALPPAALVKGANVLAIELHRSAVAGPLSNRGGWSHLGFRSAALTGPSGAGAVAYADALKGVRVWNAGAVEQVADALAADSMVRRSMFKTMIWARGLPLRGVQVGNPFDPPRPVRMAAPRNGVCCGQAVLSDLAGLRGVKAAVGPLKGPAGATIPPAAVQVRFAVQHAGLHYCDALMPAPPAKAVTVPVWVIVQVPKAQPPGWYAGTLSLEACARSFSLPVQVLVTGLVLPDARDFTSDIGAASSPDQIAAHYKVQPWSEAHWRLLEPSMALLGQLGNDVLQVPVITRNQFNWRLPLIRWTKTPAGLKPDFTVFNRYLDLYARYCAPPKALCLYIWDALCATRVANSYEGRQIPSRTYTARQPLMVCVVDPATGQTSEAPAPRIGDEGAEAFYRTLLDGVREIVTKRGWPQRCILLATGGDMRPSTEDGALLRKWAPYARWDILSHFSGDPGEIFYRGPLLEKLKAGKLIAVGDLEVGLKEHPWTQEGRALSAVQLEKRLANPTEFLELGTGRWEWQDYSPPFCFRTYPMLWANLGRIGLDFWDDDRNAARNTSYFTNSRSLTVPGPAGAVPTVRFQMMRQAVQDAELRLAIVRACLKMPEDARKPYRALLDEFGRRVACGRDYLSQQELGYGWQKYVVEMQQTAAELCGAATSARWDAPPQ